MRKTATLCVRKELKNEADSQKSHQLYDTES
jgi:hypothetical protein